MGSSRLTLSMHQVSPRGVNSAAGNELTFFHRSATRPEGWARRRLGLGLITVSSTGIRLTPSLERVIAKPFLAHTGGVIDQVDRLEQIVERIRSLSSNEVAQAVESVRSRFQHRHRDIDDIWRRHLDLAGSLVPSVAAITDESLRTLLGATFTQEYAIEGAALTNPSMVSTGDGEFVVSLRAIGEGHISSIEFRRGRISSDGAVSIDDPSPYARPGRREETPHDRDLFASKLAEMEADDEIAGMVFALLPDLFSRDDLDSAIAVVASKDRVHPRQAETTFHMLHWLATSNYDLVFEDVDLSERVLFPAGPADSGGMEDARFVRFVDDDDTVRYYATYTAFDGFRILPQLITTTDFASFSISTLHGTCAQNKGMALFPRKIDGEFVALGRHDQTNLHLLWSDDGWEWNNAEKLASPEAGWESTHIGNCGSPIETSEGWLVITHGVGPMRTYCLGALLLDLDSPEKVVGRLPEPLLEPAEQDRNGYVPNVVYSCGSMVHGSTLILPYGIADREVAVGLVDVNELIEAMA